MRRGGRCAGHGCGQIQRGISEHFLRARKKHSESELLHQTQLVQHPFVSHLNPLSLSLSRPTHIKMSPHVCQITYINTPRTILPYFFLLLSFCIFSYITLFFHVFWPYLTVFFFEFLIASLYFIVLLKIL